MMLLRHVMRVGSVGGYWGVLRPACPPSTPTILSVCRGRSRGVSEAPYMTLGRGNDLYTDRVSFNAFTWTRRKRRRLMERFLSTSCPCYSSDFAGSVGGMEIEDDEAEELVMVEQRGGGKFYDTQHHYHHNIKTIDIGFKVNVGEPVLSELQRLFNIPRETALKMVRSDNFLLVSDPAILHTLYFLRDNNISSEQLQRIPWLLLQSADTLLQKFERLQDPQLFLSLTDGLGFCHLSSNQISRYQRKFIKEAAQFPNHPNRVYYIAERLETPVAAVAEKIVRPKQVLHMDINKINSFIDIFHKYGINMKDVVLDLWVFCHNMQLTEERLKVAVKAGCTHPKPWICHASPQVFERFLERLKIKTKLLGKEGDLETYLSERLCCPISEIHTAFHRNPNLSRVHVIHIKNKLDLLFSEGFTPKDVRAFIRILQYSVNRIKWRIEEMKSLEEFPFPISILSKPQRTYFNIIQKIKKTKKLEERMREKEKEEVVNGK